MYQLPRKLAYLWPSCCWVVMCTSRDVWVVKLAHVKVPPVDSALRWSFQTQAMQASTPQWLQHRQQSQERNDEGNQKGRHFSDAYTTAANFCRTPTSTVKARMLITIRSKKETRTSLSSHLPAAVRLGAAGNSPGAEVADAAAHRRARRRPLRRDQPVAAGAREAARVPVRCREALRRAR